MNISELVNNYEDTKEFFGWKETYKNFLEVYNSTDEFYSEMLCCDRVSIEGMAHFWEHESTVHDYVESVTIEKKRRKNKIERWTLNIKIKRI